MSQQPKLSKIAFQQAYATDEACEKQLFHMKWPDGYKCERCGCVQHSTITTRNLPLYQCAKCGYQATVTVNTIMEKTRIPLTKWFIAIYEIATDKRGYSATQLMKDVEVSYPTAWLMIHKIRQAMESRDRQYQLSGIVEMDDAYIGGKDEDGKRGRGTDKTKVFIGLSLDEKGHPEYVKMEVTQDIKGNSILDFAGRNIVEGSKISSDAYRSYNSLATAYNHNPKKFNSINDPDHLKWLHVVLSNAKAFIQGTFHGLDSKHLQRYLNEFCYRFNRRKFEGQGFFRLLASCASAKTITYHELTL